MKIEVSRLMQSMGLFFLYIFFYSYGVGGSVGLGQYYLLFIYIAIAIAFLIFIHNTRCLERYRQYYTWMGLFILFQACTLVYTINFSNGLSWLSASIKIVVKITAVIVICKDFSGILKFFRGIAYIGGAVFLTLLGTGHLYEGWRLGTDLLGNANAFAMVVMFYSLGAMVSFFNEKTIAKRIIFALLFILDLYMIFLSGGRKFLLFQVVFIYASLLIGERKVKLKNIVGGTIVVALIVYIGYRVIMSVPILYSSIGIRLIGLNSAEGALGVNDQFALMKRGLEMFAKKPLFGWGISGFQQYHGLYYGKSFYAHSNYVELLADYGLFGFFLYVSMYIRCLRTLFKPGTVDVSERRLFLPLLLSVIVLDVFSVTFNQTAFVPMFIMMISGTLARKSDRADEMSIEDQNQYLGDVDGQQI